MLRRLLPLACVLGLLAPTAILAQPATISGQVSDENGERIPGANVFIPSLLIGGTTDIDGVYSFEVPAENVTGQTVTVTARFIGYASVERQLVLTSGEHVIDFVLDESVLSLDQVVVTGVVDPVSGKKLPFTVSRISDEALTAVPTSSSALAALQGKVAGVNVISGGGQPGDGVSIQLRTPTSVLTGNSPLIVVDGVILGNTSTIDISALDFESVEVIKGAAAASLYGSRAAAGVIQYTTARGRSAQPGQTRATFRTELGRSSAPTNVKLAQSHYYVTNAEGLFVDADGNVLANQRDATQRVLAADRIMDKAYGGPLYDNVGSFFQPGVFNVNSATVAHNGEMTNFQASFVNQNNAGSLVNNTGFEQSSFRVNLEHRLRDDLSLSVGAFHSRSYQDELSGSPFFDLLLYTPEVDLGVKDSLGNYLQQPDPLVIEENPLWRQGSRDNYNRRARTQASLNARYSPLSWLSLQGTLSYDRADLNSQVYVPRGTPLSLVEDRPSTGQLSKDDNTLNAYNGLLSANLSQRFGQLNSRLTFQGSFEREQEEYISAQGTDFFVPNVPDLSVAKTPTISSSYTEIRSNGMLADLGLDYGGKYIGSFLVRRDGSSLFGPEERWNTYYRAAAAYRMAEESWWPLKRSVTEFKPRFARGTAGNRPLFSYQYETWSVNGTTGAVSKGNLGNRFLKPEHVTENEYGLDMIFFNRFQLQLVYVQTYTEDLILQLPQRAITGYSSQYANIGAQEGDTYELTFEAQLVNQRRFDWSTTVVADRSRSRMVEWNRPAYTNGIRKFDKGASLSEMWGQRFISSANELPAVHQGSHGAFQVNDDGYLVAVGEGNSWTEGITKNLWGTDVIVDGVSYKWGHPIRLLDENGFPAFVSIGQSAPDLNLGFINNIRFGGFSVYSLIQAQVGGDVYNQTRQRMYQYLRHSDVDQSGKSVETKKEFEYYRAGLYNSLDYVNEFVEDGSYLKLRELAVRYAFSRDQLARWGLGGVAPQRLSIGVLGRNLLTFTGYSGFDPEVGSALVRIDSFAYPNTRTLTGTLEITF
jgi:TonB-linked SusC/RagA family outer membrane protein